MRRPYTRVLIPILLLSLAFIPAGCSVRKDVSSAPAQLGPYPLGVSAQHGRYILRLRAVSVRAADSVSLSRRTDTDPNALADTSTPDPDGMPLVNAFLVAAGPSPAQTARPGYRFVDALVAIRGRGDKGTFDLKQSVIATVSVLAGGRSYSLGDSSLGFTYGSPVLHSLLEFEVPETAKDAVVVMGLQDETQTVTFRLW